MDSHSLVRAQNIAASAPMVLAQGVLHNEGTPAFPTVECRRELVSSSSNLAPFPGK